jgi:hypothetical protein
MSVCCVCCQVEVSATSWSLVQRSPTDRGASLCVITKTRERGGHSPRWAAEPEKIIIIIIKIKVIEENKLTYKALITHVYFHRCAPLRGHFKVDRARHNWLEPSQNCESDY